MSDRMQLGCSDKRKDPPTYVREIKVKDICTNTQDYFEGQQEILRLQEIVVKLKAKLKRCKARR